MKPILKKYIPVRAKTNVLNGNTDLALNVKSEYYDTFDTEEEAIKYAYKKDPWDVWVILTQITFNNFE